MDDRRTRRGRYPLTIPDALLQSEAMRCACATRNFQEIFRLVNRRTGTSHAAMAAAIGKMSSSRVSDVIRGVRGIRGQGVMERVADGFGIPGDMLELPRRPWEESVEILDATVSAPARVRTMMDVEYEARSHHVGKNPGSLDLLTVAGLRQRVQHLDVRYVNEPSTALIAETGQHLGQLAHWQNHSTTHRIRRDLLAAQAEASTLMGQLVWDASGRTEHTTARAYFRQAASAARALRDPVAEGLALLRMCFVAPYGEKDPRGGLELARQTGQTVSGASNVLTGLAVLHAAEAHAMLGERRDCERSLSSAERHLAGVSSGDAAAPLFSPEQFGRLAGSCFLAMDDAARAQTLLEEANGESRDGSKSHAIVLANLALCCVRQRKVDEAVGALHSAIDIVECHRGGGGLNLVFRAGRELQVWRDVPAVWTLQDRLMGLIAA